MPESNYKSMADFCLVFLIFVPPIIGFPILLNSTAPRAEFLDFLQKFGYIEESDTTAAALYTDTGISEIVTTVQKFGGIEQTGIIDNETLKLMSLPRCGVPDIIRNNKRRKRYILGPGAWNKRLITYFIANWSPKLGEAVVADHIEKALNAWGRYGRLEFQKASTPNADIIVAFGSGYHGDSSPFDGSGNILAHAFFPYEEQNFGGDIHFDADEDWVDGQEKAAEGGVDFLTVAVHELGHSLGLSHSPIPDSIMFPYYQGTPNGPLNLGYDDILGMYELYIRRDINDTGVTSEEPSTTSGSDDPTTIISETTTIILETTTATIETTFEDDHENVSTHIDHDPTHTIPSTNSPSLPNLCDGYLDAVAVLRDEIFIFKEQYVWRMTELKKIEQGYPILIEQMFPKLPKNLKKIDAAYERPDGMVILFIGTEFWVYDGEGFIDSPRPLTDYGLAIDKIDAVQIWAKNQKTYFYKDDIFWRYNETSKTMDAGYPKHMERWRGVPHNLDAAVTWKGITYFFKDELYYKFDNDWVAVTDQSPMPTPQLWLGCPEDDWIGELFQ